MSESVEQKRKVPHWVKPTLIIGIPILTAITAAIIYLGNVFGPDLKFEFSFGDYIGFNYSRNKTTGVFPQTNYLGYTFWISAGQCQQTNLTSTSGRVQWEIGKVVTGITNRDGSVEVKSTQQYIGQNFRSTPTCPS